MRSQHRTSKMEGYGKAFIGTMTNRMYSGRKVTMESMPGDTEKSINFIIDTYEKWCARWSRGTDFMM